MSISNKIFGAVILIVFFVALVGAISSVKLTQRGFDVIFKDLTSSLHSMEDRISKNFIEMGESQGIGILNLAQIAAGDSLLPGEEKKFEVVAKQIGKLKGIEEFSFFNSQGKVVLSSVDEAVGRKLEKEIMEKSLSSKSFITKQDQNYLHIYKTIYVNEDMIRFNPNWKVGDFLGLLYLKISKNAVNSLIKKNKEQILSIIDKGKNNLTKTMKNNIYSAIIVGIISLIIGVTVIWSILTTSLKKPLMEMIEFASAMAQGDFSKTMEVTNKDEVGKVIDAMNNVSKSTQDIISQFNKAVKEISHGKLDYRADESGLDGGFKDLIRGANKIADTYEVLINNLPIGIVNMDKDLKIKYVNSEVQKMIGRDLNSLIGTNCWNHFNTSICQTNECVCKKTLESRDIHRAEIEAKINSEIKHLDITAFPVWDLNGNVVGATNVVYDLTEIKNYEKLQDTINSVVYISSNLASASAELAAQVEEVSRSVDEQSNKIGEIATAMEEMSSTVLEVSKNAQHTAEAANDTKNMAQEGTKAVNESFKLMKNVHEKAKQLLLDMKEMESHVQGIGELMDTISDIADQTNLLALNAAIEAARAGEAGRGFAVVADEVRKLAEKTMSATIEVGEFIKKIQETSNMNMQSTEAVNEAIEENMELAKTAEALLNKMLELSQSTSDQVRNIATAAEEQSATTEQISRSTEEVNVISQEIRETMNQSVQAITDLNGLAQQLNNHIEEMKRI
ncbi:methyl-accepting chemotaxis protein [Desulfothermus sp.]